MATTFHDRIRALREQVGSSEAVLRGSVVVDQRYAHVQHERLDFRHPRGGQALYLAEPLMRNHRRYLQDYADAVLDNGGHDAMIRAVEDLAGSGGVATHAPVELGDLRASGHPSVRLGERQVYDRPAAMHRLSPSELKAKSRVIMDIRWRLGLPVFWTRNGKVMVARGRR